MWFETNLKASQMDQYFSVDCPFKSCSISSATVFGHDHFRDVWGRGGRAGLAVD